MIIFYNKTTGEIVGTTGGRVHQPEELKMWIGDPQKVDRIVIEWKPSAWKKEKDGKKTAIAFEPDCDKELKPMLEKIEKNPSIIHEKYKIDISSGKLKEMTQKELSSRLEEVEKIRQIAQEKTKERKNIIKDILDTKKPLEERFNNLLKIISINENQKTPFDISNRK